MSEKLKIASDGCVVVCDGRKALIMKNQGDERYLNLKVQQVLEAPSNPPTHDQGSDKPPRALFAGRRSSFEQTDWHELAEHKFAAVIADAIETAHRNEPMGSLVLVAPARMLANLRKSLSEQLRRVVTAEIDKDLTKHPVYDIEHHLTGT